MSNLPTGPPTGTTTHRWYAAGYQQALADLLIKLEEGGEEAAREWITNNTILRYRSDQLGTVTVRVFDIPEG